MRSRLGLGLAVALVGCAVLFLSGPRVRVLPYGAAPPALPEDLDRWLAEREAGVLALRPGLQKGIRWAGARGARTPLAILYLHGFSASRGELSPIVEQLGEALSANVFFTRLSGHGQDGEALRTVRPNDWLADADEALTIGRRLGQRVVVIGMSTGGTLATWLAARTPDLAALVLLSPNFGLKDKMARLLLLPWGLQLAKLSVGDYHSFQPRSPLQQQRWTTRYRVEGLLPMMALVHEVDGMDLRQMKIPTLIVYAPKDDVLDVPRMLARYGELGAARKALIAMPDAKHVLAGDAVGPERNAALSQHILTFLRSL